MISVHVKQPIKSIILYQSLYDLFVFCYAIKVTAWIAASHKTLLAMTAPRNDGGR